MTSLTVLSRKLSSLVNIPLEDPSLQQSLLALDDIDTRNLQQTVEKQLLNLNKKYLTSVDILKHELSTIESAIVNLNNICKSMDDKLKNAYLETDAVIRTTTDLKNKVIETDIQKRILDTFLKEFTLSDSQINTLLASPINSEFFDALSHLQKVDRACLELLMDDESTIVANDILQDIKQCREAAFDRLYKWTQSQMFYIKVDSPEISKDLRMAMQFLKTRPILFQSIVDEISSIRKNAIVTSFLDALTIGSVYGFPRPIELHAHDPIRFMGDMLAWVHQASASEREMLNALFNLSAPQDFGRRVSESVLKTINDFEPERISVLNSLEKNLDGICRPLKSRVDQLLQSNNEKSLLLYRLENIVQFYGETILKITGPNASIYALMVEITASIKRTFFASLNSKASLMITHVESPGKDLQPVPLFQDFLNELKEILFSHEKALSETEISLSECKDIIAAVIDPLMQSSMIASNQLGPLDSAIFTVNCLHAIQNTLNMFSFAIEQVAQLDSQIESQIEVLVKEQYSVILKQSGIGSLVQLIESNKKQNISISKDSRTNSTSVKEAMVHLDKFLASMGSDISSSLSRIISVKIVKRVYKRGLVRFLETYRGLYNDIMDETNGYDGLVKLRTVEDMETLLSINN